MKNNDLKEREHRLEIEKRKEALRRRKRVRTIQRRCLFGALISILLFIFISSVAMKETGDLETEENTYEEVEYKPLYFYNPDIVKERPFIVDPKKPMIALTFDDGPGKYTEDLLDIVDENNVHITFFLLGNNIKEEYSGTLQRMVELGCEVSNHSKNHANFTQISKEEMLKQVAYTNGEIEKYTGSPGKNFRPPYGAINHTVRGTVPMPFIMWSVDTLDWKTKNVNSTVEKMTTNIKDGDILLLHDIHPTTVEAAGIAIPMLLEQGFQIVTVDEMATAKGVTLENGEKYFGF